MTPEELTKFLTNPGVSQLILDAAYSSNTSLKSSESDCWLCQLEAKTAHLHGVEHIVNHILDCKVSGSLKEAAWLWFLVHGDHSGMRRRIAHARLSDSSSFEATVKGNHGDALRQYLHHRLGLPL